MIIHNGKRDLANVIHGKGHALFLQNKKKNPQAIDLRASLRIQPYAKTMGEEKPAEKLMGKRKSPRLEQHHHDVVFLLWTHDGKAIHKNVDRGSFDSPFCRMAVKRLLKEYQNESHFRQL